MQMGNEIADSVQHLVKPTRFYTYSSSEKRVGLVSLAFLELLE